MQIFISWSGERSKQVGLLLKEWIKCVLQVSKPWISDVDIDRGSVWFSEIGKALDGCVNGIICLTKGNLLKPWLLFEAGALAKGLTSSRVCTFLIDVQPGDVGDPLSQFNHTLPNEEGLRKLVITLNSRLGDSALANEILNKVFDTYWPQFNEKFQEILKETVEEKLPTRSEKDVLSEVLYTIRRIDKRLSTVEGVVGDYNFEINKNMRNYSSDVFVTNATDEEKIIIAYLINASCLDLSSNELMKNISAKFGITYAKARHYINIASDIVAHNKSAT